MHDRDALLRVPIDHKRIVSEEPPAFSISRHLLFKRLVVFLEPYINSGKYPVIGAVLANKIDEEQSDPLLRAPLGRLLSELDEAVDRFAGVSFFVHKYLRIVHVLSRAVLERNGTAFGRLPLSK